MSDYISRQALVDACDAYLKSPWANGKHRGSNEDMVAMGVRDALLTIRADAQTDSPNALIGIGLPSADVVEVVRCRECEGWVATENSDLGLCALTKRVVTRRD